PLEIVANRANDVAFHDLGVIDVVQNPDARRVYPLAHLDAPPHLVEMVVLVVDFAIQVLEAEGDLLVLSHRLDAVEIGDRIRDSLLVTQAAAVPGERDHVRRSGRAGGFDRFTHALFDAVMEFFAIDAVGDGAAAGYHGRNQTVLLQNRKIRWADEVES